MSLPMTDSRGKRAYLSNVPQMIKSMSHRLSHGPSDKVETGICGWV